MTRKKATPDLDTTPDAIQPAPTPNLTSDGALRIEALLNRIADLERKNIRERAMVDAATEVIAVLQRRHWRTVRDLTRQLLRAASSLDAEALKPVDRKDWGCFEVFCPDSLHDTIAARCRQLGQLPSDYLFELCMEDLGIKEIVTRENADGSPVIRIVRKPRRPGRPLRPAE